MINNPVERIERTYIDGYRERIVERPGGNTEPLPAVVLPPMEQTQPPVTHVHVASPTSPSGERNATRSPNRDTQKERDEPGHPAMETRPPTPDARVPYVEAAPVSDRPVQTLVPPSGSSAGTHVPEVQKDRKKNPPIPEEKSSDDEPTSGRKRRKYNGKGGRIHTEAQIDELLDFYLMTGELPIYVSDRQRYDYRHHLRLPEREELLVKRGISVKK